MFCPEGLVACPGGQEDPSFLWSWSFGIIFLLAILYKVYSVYKNVCVCSETELNWTGKNETTWATLLSLVHPIFRCNVNYMTLDAPKNSCQICSLFGAKLLAHMHIPLDLAGWIFAYAGCPLADRCIPEGDPCQPPY